LLDHADIVWHKYCGGTHLGHRKKLTPEADTEKNIYGFKSVANDIEIEIKCSYKCTNEEIAE
jgi:hypothetical protein